MKYMIWMITILFSIFFCTGKGKAEVFSQAKLDTLLRTFMFDGKINYSGIKASPRLINDYARQLSQVKPKDFEQWSPAEKNAFWINAYNAMAIKGVAQNYPIKWGGLFVQTRFPKNSIYQIKKFGDRSFIKIMKQGWTLKKIRNKIFLKAFVDPRNFFAINSGQAGDPPIQERAFRGDSLDMQLEEAVHDFLWQPGNLSFDSTENKLQISALFDTYKHQFVVTTDLQEYEINRRDSIKKVLVDSVLEALPAKVVQLYYEAHQHFEENKQQTVLALEQQLETVKRQIEQENATIQEIKTMPIPPPMNGQVLDSATIVDSMANEMAGDSSYSSLGSEPKKSRPDSVKRYFEKMKAFVDSSVAAHQQNIDSLNYTQMALKDSIDFTATTRLDSASFHDSTYEQCHTESIANLPAVPFFDLQKYKKEYHGVMIFLMRYFPEHIREYIRQNHPVIDIQSFNRELNETIF